MLGVELPLGPIPEDPLMQARRRPAPPVPLNQLGQPRGLLERATRPLGCVSLDSLRGGWPGTIRVR
jgi:hypothetical protein